MSFIARPRFNVCFPATYEVSQVQGEGTVSDLSATGFRLSTDLLFMPGQICSLTLNLPNNEQVRIAAGIIRWMRDGTTKAHRSPCDFVYGVEVLVADERAKKQLVEYLKLQVSEEREEITRKS
jgi:PilZ domain